MIQINLIQVRAPGTPGDYPEGKFEEGKIMQRILVPLDGSELSELALKTARPLARHWGAELILVRVGDPFVGSLAGPIPTQAVRWVDAEQAGARQYLDAMVESLASEGFRAKGHFLTGLAQDQIVRAARSRKADLIVICSHGRSGIMRWLLGSVAENVLRRAPCPVLLVRPGSPPLTEAGFRRVLVPLDGSPLASAVVEQVAPFVAEDGAVSVLTATNLLPLDLYREAREECVRDLEAELARSFPKKDRYVFDGDAADVILTFARQSDSDLVAMSTHGRSGFKRTMLGSVTERVARHASCSVLAFPPAARPPKV